MKKIITTFIVFFSLNTYSQEVEIISKIIVDSISKKPLEYADIYNHFDFTASNDEGNFRFATNEKFINFRLLGYKTLSTTIANIKNIDTIFLSPDLINLNEVLVSNSEPTLKKIFKNLETNVADFPYTEKFFMRIILKRNDEIVKFQDISAKVNRLKTFTNLKDSEKNIKIELLNMRKTGILSKSRKVEYFKFFSFAEFFYNITAIYAIPEKHNFIDNGLMQKELKKISFEPKNDSLSNSIFGYYIFDKNNYRLKEVMTKSSQKYYESTSYSEKGGFKWKTISRDLIVKFNYDSIHKKEYISYGKLNYKVKVINPELENIIYDVQYDFITTESFLNESIKSDFNPTKDIFKAEFDYNEYFWKNQNQLLLNNELKKFLNRADLNNDKKSDYMILKNY